MQIQREPLVSILWKEEFRIKEPLIPGYLKNVEETSGFYERNSGLWERVFDLFNSFENRDHFENHDHI
jgi:hypothetical protein